MKQAWKFFVLITLLSVSCVSKKKYLSDLEAKNKQLSKQESKIKLLKVENDSLSLRLKEIEKLPPREIFIPDPETAETNKQMNREIALLKAQVTEQRQFLQALQQSLTNWTKKELP